MKTLSSILLVASLAVNAAFAYLIITDNAGAPAIAVESSKSVASTAQGAGSPSWSDLKSDDLPTLLERLRTSGFPPHVIRALVSAQLNQDLEARMKALQGKASQEYWKNADLDPRQQRELSLLYRERQKQLEALLGPDPDDASMDAMLTYLPAEKCEALRQLNKSFNDRLMEMYSNAGTIDATKYRELQKQQHDAIAAVLTPAELLDYDLRNSSTAASLRTRLAGFNPSESEFRAIYALQAQFEQQYAYEPGMTQEQMRARSDAQKALTEQIKATLSPERAAVYDRMSDYNYARTSQLVARLELPPETTDRLYNLQKEYQQRRMEQMRGASAPRTRDAIIEQTTALQQEALGKLTTVLGSPSAVEAYKQYGGSWVDSMVPRVTNSPTGPNVVAPAGTTTTIIRSN